MQTWLRFSLLAALGLAALGCARKGSTSVASSNGPTSPAQRLPLSPPATGQLVGGLDSGQLAPDIEGDDLDGKRFKLSDYRGKVVLLDFWGSW